MSECVPKWKVAGASIGRAGRAAAGHECQDCNGWVVARDWLGIAVADGAGSAPRSAIGGVVAVRAALSADLQAHLIAGPFTAEKARVRLTGAFEAAATALFAEAATLGVAPSDLATTLIMLIAGADFVAVGHVGDGAVVIDHDGGELLTISAPANGEFANETAMLGCGESFDVRVTTLSEIRPRHIAVFTDSFQRLALRMPSCAPHPGFFAPLFRHLAGRTEEEMQHAIGAFINSPRVAARTNDDTTLLVAHLE